MVLIGRSVECLLKIVIQHRILTDEFVQKHINIFVVRMIGSHLRVLVTRQLLSAPFVIPIVGLLSQKIREKTHHLSDLFLHGLLGPNHIHN
jgi:hypothetical protein